NVLNVSFSCGNSDDCKVVLESVIEAYQDWLNKKYKTVSGEALAQIATTTAILEKRLHELEAKYDEFRQENPLVIFTSNGEARSLHENWLGQIQSEKLTNLGLKAKLNAQVTMLQKAQKEGRGNQELMMQLSARPIGSQTDSARITEKIFDLELQ